jgi:nitronate monooxygenase
MAAHLPDSGIVLAPLAGGPATPELAAAVTDGGGLGFLAAGYLQPETFRDHIHRARALTAGPLGANLFCLREEPVHDEAIAAYAVELAPEAARFGVELGEPRFDDDAYGAKLDVVADEGVDIVSFTFGCPTEEEIARLQVAGIEVWVTVTSSAEAVDAAARGADALVAQGSEAGGHRGAWRDDATDLPLLELLGEVRGVCDTTLVATGGVGDRGDVVAALDAGASAVQAGTAFLLCPEAGTSEPHRVLLERPGTTAVTRAFTGRRARGIVNEFMRDHPHAPSAYPHVHHLTAPLRAAARAAGDADRINLWAGERFAAARAVPAAEVVAALRA